MKEVEPNKPMELAKSQSRGMSGDMSAEAILRRLEIVDELRELAKELQMAKRLGSLEINHPQVTKQVLP